MNAEAKFARAMAGAGRTQLGVVPVKLPVLRQGGVELGQLDTGGVMGINLRKLIEGRLLIQGASGAGKSWTLRRLMEQTAGLIQQILIDPEGEFKSLAEEVEMVVIDAAKLDTAAVAIAAQRAREHRLSVLLDLSELDREEQMKMFAAFLGELIEAPRQYWNPCIITVDEAHLFAPFGGQSTESTSVRKAAVAALVDLMARGRKRGLCGTLATQRLARLSKSVVSEVHNFLIGINTLDLDIRRAAVTVGWDARRAFDKLPILTPGDFVPVGPAFSHTAGVVRIGPVATSHNGASPELRRYENIEPKKAAELLALDSLFDATAHDAAILEDARKPQGYNAVRAFLREKQFAPAARVWAELVPLAPEGAKIADLATHLKIARARIADALAMLDQFGAVEFSGTGKARAVRCGKGMV